MENLHAILDAEYAAGTIDEAEYRAVAKTAPPARSDASLAGKGSKTDRDNRPEQSEGLVDTKTPPPGGVSVSGDPVAELTKRGFKKNGPLTWVTAGGKNAGNGWREVVVSDRPNGAIPGSA